MTGEFVKQRRPTTQAKFEEIPIGETCINLVDTLEWNTNAYKVGLGLLKSLCDL
jgi:hypothetical protein